MFLLEVTEIGKCERDLNPDIARDFWLNDTKIRECDVMSALGGKLDNPSRFGKMIGDMLVTALN